MQHRARGHKQERRGDADDKMVLAIHFTRMLLPMSAGSEP